MFNLFKKKPKDVIPFTERRAITVKDFSDFGIPKDTIVTVTGCDNMRGYDFKDDRGHFVAETGWFSVKFLDD